MLQKQELVSPQLGSPLFTEYDHDGLLLDLFGSYDGEEFDVLDVSITGTRFSVLQLIPAEMIEDMNLWCERENDKELDAAVEESAHDLRSVFRRDLQDDLEGRN